MNSYSYYVPGSLPFTPNSTRRTLEVNSIRSINFNTISIIPANYALTLDSNSSTYWSSDIMSTVYGLGSAGYISSLYTTLYLDYISSVVPLTFTADYISSINNLYISTGNSAYEAIFSEGTISTNTCVVYGSNTFIVQGTVQMNDTERNILIPMFLSNSRLYVDYRTPYYINKSDIVSTIEGIKLHYADGVILNSTLEGIMSGVTYGFIASTLEGLGTMSYISTISLLSTTQGLILYGGAIKNSNFTSTIGGLNSIYISSPNIWTSTSEQLYANLNVVSSNTLQSTVKLLANYYISSSALTSTNSSLYSKYIYNTFVISSINNLPYVSSKEFPVVAQNLLSNLYLPENLASSIDTVYNFYLPTLENTIGYNLSSNIITNFNWILCGSNGSGYQIGYSLNGINWTDLPITIGGPINTIVKYKGLYIAGSSDSNSSLLYSYDGITWNPALIGSNFLEKVVSIAYSSNLIVAAGSNPVAGISILHSSDGILWADSSSGSFRGDSNSVANSVAYGNGVWVSAGFKFPGSATIIYSINGSNWLNAIGSYPNYPATGIAYYNNVWACGGQTAHGINGQKVFYSLDGSNWSNANNSDIFGGNIETLAQAGTLFFATCLDTVRNIKYSRDGSNWENVVSQGFPLITSGSFTMSFAYNGSYIATLFTDNPLRSNSIITSPDGLNWTVNINNYNNAFGIAYTPSGYINYSNTLMSSYNWITFGFTSPNSYNIGISLDGSNWNKIVFPAQAFVNTIVKYGNKYIAGLSYSPSLIYSYDGQYWSLVTSGYNLFDIVSQIAYNGSNLLIAAGDNPTGGPSLLYSIDGLNWSFVNSGSFDSPSPINTSVIYSSNIWIAGGAPSVAVSPIIYSFNGLNWLNTSGPFNSTAPSVGVGFYNNIWVSGQYNVGLYYSLDGSNWSNANTAFPTVTSVSQAGSLWFATGPNATMNIKYSRDGSNWQNVVSQGFSPITGQDIFINFAYNGSNLYVGTLQQVAGVNGKIITSPDGSNWTANTSNTFDNPYCVSYLPYSSNAITVPSSPFNWIAVGKNIILSQDGLYWTTQPSPMTTINTVITDGYRYIIGGNDILSPIQYSYNGVLWILTNVYSVLHIVNSIAYSSNLYVAVGQNPNTIAYSEDLITWKPAVSGSFSVVGNGVTYGNGIWAATGEGGATILYSRDGSNWSNAVSGGITTTGVSILYNNGVWVAGGIGTSNLQYSINGSNWSNTNINPIGDFKNISFTGNLWFASGKFSLTEIIYYSYNGSNWSLATGTYPANATAKSVSYNGSNLYLCPISYSTSNTIISSTDGINWYYNSNSPINVNNSILYTNSIYYNSNAFISYISTIDVQSTVDFYFSNYLLITDLQSSVDGVGATYISTISLISTSETLFAETISLFNWVSTVTGLGSICISSYYGVQSTVSNILSYGLNKSILISSTRGIQYPTVLNMQSTIEQILDPTNSLLPVHFFSTITGLASGPFISTASLASTVDGFFNTYLIDSNLASTVDNLSLVPYISSLHLASTLDSLFNDYPIDITSTIDGLLYANYNTSDDVASTFTGIDTTLYNPVTLTSTVSGLGNQYYISTSQLLSTSVFFYSNTVYKKDFPSTIKGLGSLYVSSSALASSIFAFRNNTNLIPLNMFVSSIKGIGNKYISSPALDSTLRNVLPKYIFMDTIMSTIDGLGTVKYISTQQITSSLDSVYNNLLTIQGLQSTITGLETTYIDKTDLVSTNEYFIANTITTPLLLSSVMGVGSSQYVSSQGLVSTTSNFFSNYFFKPVVISTVRGLGLSGYVSTTQLTSSVAFTINPANFVSPSNLVSSVQGLGTVKYTSSIQLQSSITSIIERIIFQSNINSTINGIGMIHASTNAITSSLDLFLSNYAIIDFYPSTFDGLGLFGFISTNDTITSINYINSNTILRRELSSSIRGLGTLNYVSSASLRSTVTEFIKMTTYVPRNPSYIFPYSNIIGLMNITSSVAGIGSHKYISTSALRSTVSNFIDPANILTQSNINVTIPTIGQTYLSTASLPSTVDAIWALRIPPRYLFSAIIGLGSIYISSATLISTTQSLGFSGIYTTNSNMYDQVVNLGTVYNDDSYVSSKHLFSTVYSINLNPKISPNNLASTVRGFGTVDYISSSHIASTIRGVQSNLLIYYPNIDGLAGIYGVQTTFTTSNLCSTTAKILSSSNISTPNLRLTVISSGNLYVSSFSVASSIIFMYNNRVKTIDVMSTVTKLDSVCILRNSLLSTNIGLNSNSVSKGDFLRSTFVALGEFYVSTSRNITQLFGGNPLISTFSTVFQGFEASNLQSTVGGLNSIYTSSLDIISTADFYINNFITLNLINGNDLQSFTINIGDTYNIANSYAYKDTVSSLSGNLKTLTAATNALYVNPPNAGLNSFIACFISQQNNNTVWDVIYTYDGLTFNTASRPPLLGRTMDAYSVIGYNGNVFLIPWASFTTNLTYLWYSFDGVYWIESSFTAPYSYYPRISSSSRVTVWTGNGTTGAYPYIGYFSYNNPNIWYPILTSYITPSLGFNATTFVASLQQVTNITNNGRFFVISGSFSGTYNGLNGACVLISYTGSNWIQCNVGVTGTTAQGCFTIGSWNYVGDSGGYNYNRSMDGIIS